MERSSSIVFSDADVTKYEFTIIGHCNILVFQIAEVHHLIPQIKQLYFTKLKQENAHGQNNSDGKTTIRQSVYVANLWSRPIIPHNSQSIN